jgi:hypothetical protein
VVGLIGLGEVGLVRLSRAFEDPADENLVVAVLAFAMAFGTLAVLFGYFLRPGGDDDDDGGEPRPEPPPPPSDPPWWDDFERDLNDWSGPDRSPTPPAREPIPA